MSAARLGIPLGLTGALAIMTLLCFAPARPQAAPTKGGRVSTPLSYTVADIDGSPVDLSRYRGRVVMIVNVASYCGNTPQYASLQALYEKYHDRGFTVLGFPSNDFGKQEPGSNTDIKQFCSAKYHVTFPMFSKIVVKGEGQAPLYQFLTDKKTDPAFGGDIEWNFAKFLLNRQGEVVARYQAGLDPQKPEVVQAIERELGAPKPGEKQASNP